MKSLYKNSLQIVKKLKPLDWFVALLTLGIICFLGFSSLNQDRWITIEFKLEPTDAYTDNVDGLLVPYWVADSIKPGDTQNDSLGQKNLQILSVKRWGAQNEQTWVTATIKAKYVSTQKKYTYLYQPLEIGRSIDLTINGTYVHGVITYMQGFSDERPTRTITVNARLIDNLTPYSTFTRGVDPWIADAIKAGDVMKDVSGKTIAEILSVDVQPAERVVTTSDGRVVDGNDPLKKDVNLTIKLTVTKQNDSYIYLEDTPIKVGEPFPVFFNQILLHPTVTQIFE